MAASEWLFWSNNLRLARTLNLRIDSPMPLERKMSIGNDLDEAQGLAYNPAYKKFQKTSLTAEQELSEDLAEIAVAWPTLPGNIKAAILMMVKGM